MYYVNGNTLIHVLDSRVKLVSAVVLALLSLVLADLRFLTAVVVVSFTIAVVARLPACLFMRILLFLVPLTLIVCYLQGLFRPGHVIFYTIPTSFPIVSGIGPVSREGVLFGAVMCFRLISVSIIFLDLVLTTRPKDIAFALAGLGIKYQMAFVLTVLPLRLLPMVLTDGRAVMEAQAARGAHFGGLNPLLRVRSYIIIILPLTLSILRRADQMGLAMSLRGLTQSSVGTTSQRRRLNLADYFVIGFTALFIISLSLLYIYVQIIR